MKRAKSMSFEGLTKLVNTNNDKFSNTLTTEYIKEVKKIMSVKIIFANGVAVNSVGKMLISVNGEQKFTLARNLDNAVAELVQATSKPLITEVYMLPTMTRANKLTLSVEQTASIIEGVRGQGCKRGARVAFKETCSSGARYSLEEAKKLGEGVGYKLGKHQEIIPCVMPKEERIKRGLERVIEGFMVFEGNGEKDLYNPLCYRCDSVIDSLAK